MTVRTLVLKPSAELMRPVSWFPWIVRFVNHFSKSLLLGCIKQWSAIMEESSTRMDVRLLTARTLVLEPRPVSL